MKMQSLQAFETTFAGINLIEASAGTGKTYNITSLYIRALIELNLNVKNILVVTYTEAATKELRERLMTRLQESVNALEDQGGGKDEFLNNLKENVDDPERAIKKLRKAIRTFDEAAVYTIHGFCYQALQEQAFESRAMFDAEMVGDDKEIIREIIDDYWRVWVNKSSESEYRRPLVKFLMDKGYNPDSLTDELSSYIGKPYLNIRPEEISLPGMEENLQRLTELFKQLKEEWENSREEIFDKLNEGHLSNYRTGWLEGWMLQMEQWINSKVAPIELFGMFDKFTRSVIDNSLKKTSIKKGISPPEHPFFNLADSYKQTAESLGNYDIQFRLDLFRHLRDSLYEKKEELRQLSYDDLLIRLKDALTDSERGKRLSESLRNSYPVALVDEFQDTDPIQYEIFKTIYSDSPKESALFMIGDPKQSIYSFRGADIFSYLEAKGDVTEERTYSLNRNFRSVPELIEATNVFFSYHENPFILEDIPFTPVKAGKARESYRRLSITGQTAVPVEIRELHGPADDLPLNKGTAEKRSAEDTASEIQLLLRQSREGLATIGENSVKAADIAVLVRSHYQAALIRDSLKSRGIKSVQYSQDSVFKSEEAEELQYILRAIAEPAEEGYVRAALATKTMGYTAENLLKFEIEDSAWVEKLNQFSNWHEAWRENGFAYMFRQFMHEENISEKVIRRSDGERKLTNLIHLAELTQIKEQEGKTGTRSLLQWLARKRNEEQKDREEEQLRLESDENLVKVVTMHRSKGLEYPIVFCPFLWHSPEYSDKGKPIVYHDKKDGTKVYLDFHGKDDPNRGTKRFQMAKEDLAESVRLAYVAITRAEQKCIINWMHTSKSEFSPLGYLLLGREKAFDVLQGVVSKEGSYSSVPTAEFEEAIQNLIAGKSNLFNLQRESKRGQQQLFLGSGNENLDPAKKFERTVPLSPGKSVSSFSSLIQNRDDDFEIDYDIFLEESVDADTDKGSNESLTVFNFPKGPKPGTAIHHIFEEIQFGDTEDAEEIIENALARQGIDPVWVPAVNNMIEQTLTKNLLETDSQLRLAKLSPEYIMPEMEFYFSSGEAGLEELLRIIRKDKNIPRTVTGYSDDGYIKGFIDLTFKYKGRYYILDYKTNYLGDSIDSYGKTAMSHEMQEAMYDLQYHLYILALHRYLGNMIHSYSYEKYIGGAFYLFVRGINKEGMEGVYFDRPDSVLIEKLDAYLKR